MSVRSTILRFHSVVRLLKQREATFEEISSMLEESSDLHSEDLMVAQRTFQRDIKSILILYGIEIVCDKSSGKYSIVDNDESELNQRMVEAFDTLNALQLNREYNNIIHFEKRKPNGTEHLHTILHAIQNGAQIKYMYVKYWGGEVTIRNLQAYALKEFKNRWYVIGKDVGDGNVKTFSLDRMSTVQSTAFRYSIPETFSIDRHFEHCFGIMSPNADEPSLVKLEFTNHQGKYIKSLPLHSSQEILEDTDERLVVGLKVYLTEDFVMEILSHGEEVEVLEPENLRNEVAVKLESATGYYK